MTTKYDWQEVVNLKPKGYVELNDGKRVLHGPIDSMTIDDNDFVVITTKWTAKMTLKDGLPNFDWEMVIPNRPIKIPNLVMPFEIEDSGDSSRGPRVRFGLNILYINEVRGLDPSECKNYQPV